MEWQAQDFFRGLGIFHDCARRAANRPFTSAASPTAALKRHLLPTMDSRLAMLSTPELINELVCKMYEPPLSRLRERLGTLPEPLRVLMLVSDFDKAILQSEVAVGP